MINCEEDDYGLELYMTITKFEENMGFSLVQCTDLDTENDEIPAENDENNPD